MLIYLTYLVVFSLPLYLLRLKIFWIPTTVLELMIYALFIVWLVKLIMHHKGYMVTLNPTWFRVNSRFLIPILLLLSGCIISTLVSPYKLTSLGILKGWFIDPLLFFLVLITTIKTKKQVKSILTCFSLSGAVVAVIGLTYFFMGSLTFDGRLKAFFLSPNHLAMYLAPALLVACYLLLTAKRFGYFWLTVAGLMGVILYFTFSYGAWLGVVAGSLFLFWFFIKGLESSQKKRALLLYCLLALLLIVVLLTFQLGSEKFQNFLYSTRSSFQSRLMIWKAGLLILKDHPLWGIGLGTFQKYYLDYASYFKEPYLEWAVPQPHNLFLAFWLQTGILGLVGFIWIIVFFFKRGIEICRRSNLLHQTCLIAVMIYILVHGLVDTTYWKNDLSVVFWMIVGLMAVLSSLKNP